MTRIHLITSTYNDIHKFSWREMVGNNIEIFLYKKIDDLKIDESFVDEGCINIPNFGSCDYAFFYHIVSNYNDLADFNIFTKLNWIGDFSNAPDVLENCSKFDFYQGGGRPMSHVWYNDETKNFLDRPTKFRKEPMNISLTKNKKIIGSPEYDYAGNADQQVDWFNFLFSGIEPPGEVCTYEYGPCFSVSKDLILRHPLSVYEHFLNIFHPLNSWDFEAGKRFFKTDDIKHQTWAIGRHYHDELLRFYRVFFTLGVDENKYKIQKL